MEQIFKDFLEAISPALQAAIISLVTLILGQVTFFLKEQYRLAKAKATNEQQEFIDFVVHRAVQTVEQTYHNATSSEKMQGAIDLVETSLLKYGIDFDVDEIENAIEAAIFGGANIPAEVDALG